MSAAASPCERRCLSVLVDAGNPLSVHIAGLADQRNLHYSYGIGKKYEKERSFMRCSVSK